MRKSSKVIILVVVLALLAGTYVYMNNRPNKTNTAEEDKKVQLLNLEKDKITKMVLKSAKGTLTFIKKGKEWTVDYPYPVNLKQTSIDDIACSFASLFAEQIVDEKPQDLAQYGLKEPVVTAEATLEGGGTKTIYLGDNTPTGDTYYLMVKDDPKVYTVWMNHGEHFSYTLADVRDKNLPQLKTEELKYFRLQQKDGRTIEIRGNDKRSEEEAQFGLGLWQMTKPYNEPMGVDGDAFQKILEKLPSLDIKDFIDDAPSDMSKYGLDAPSYELVISDESKTLHLLFGKDADDGSVYFKTADSNSIYTMEKSKLDFMDAKPFNLVDKFAFIVNIDNVDKIIVEGNGKTHTITLSRTTKKAEEKDKEDEVITTYKVDGKEVQEDPFKKYYQSLIGLLVDAETDKQPEAAPEVKTTFYLNKGKNREISVNYAPYDRDFYVVVRGGKAEFVINRQQVQNMLNDLELLIQGKLEKK